ncbi:MAG TPA: TolC family protein [Pirellulales bacterium]|nr:TolC family protein [Pirellulales bacterium]
MTLADQGGWKAPPAAESADKPDESSAPVPKSVVDRTIGESGSDSSNGQDADEASAVPKAQTAARPPMESGGSLTLEDAKSLAMRLNPSLRQSVAAVGTAEGNEEIVHSGFLPTVQGSYSYQAFASQTGFAGTEQGGRFPILPVRGFGPGTQGFNVTEVQLRWAVYQFGRQVAKHDQSILREEIARLQVVRTRQSVMFDVSEAYFRALEARSSLVIAEQSLTSAEAILRDARNQESRGVLTAEDVLRAEVGVAEVRQLVTHARSAVRVTVAGLNRAIGLDVSAPTRLADRKEEPSVSLTLEDSLNLALQNRREIDVVRRGIADAALEVKIAKADYLPTLSVQSAVADVSGFGVQNSKVLSGGAFATVDFYTGGKRHGQLRAAEASVSQAAARAKQVVDGVAYEVHYAHTAVDDARERVVEARTAVTHARENFRMVNNRYQSGDAQPTDVIEAQTSQTRAEQQYNSNIYEYQTAVARLEFAVGTPIAGPPTPAEEITTPTPTTIPAPPMLPDTDTSEGEPPPRRARQPIKIPPLPAPQSTPDLLRSLIPQPDSQPRSPRPSSVAPAPGLARPPYAAQPTGPNP